MKYFLKLLIAHKLKKLNMCDNEINLFFKERIMILTKKHIKKMEIEN